jgi:hypothetical protein
VTSPLLNSCNGETCFVSVTYALDNNLVKFLCSYHNLDPDLYVGVDQSDGQYCEWALPVS